MVLNVQINSRPLIREMKKQRVLYDHTDKDFSNRTVRTNAWLEVTKAAIGDQFHNLSQPDRNAASIAVQKRWRHLRDSYVKTTKQNKNKPYVFGEDLSFLKGTLRNRSCSLLMTDGVDGKRPREEEEDEPPAAQPAPTSNQPHISKSIAPSKVAQSVTSRCDLPADTSSAAKGRKSNISEFEKMLLNIVKTNVEHSPSPPDPDEMFFLSQMPHIKALNPADREDFKHKFMELLKYYTVVYD